MLCKRIPHTPYMKIVDTQDEVDRDRGILTRSDRLFLIGETELEGDSRRGARNRIRDRLKNSIRDFLFLRYSLEERDRELVRDDLFSDDGALWQGYVHMYAFFYRLQVEEGFNISSPLHNAIQSAEEEFEKERGLTVETDITVDVDRTVVADHSELHEKWENHEPLTPDEAHTLFIKSTEFDHLTDEERWTHFREFLNGESETPCILEEDEDDDEVPLA